MEVVALGAMAPRFTGKPEATLTAPEPVSTAIPVIEVMVAFDAGPEPEFNRLIGTTRVPGVAPSVLTPTDALKRGVTGVKFATTVEFALSDRFCGLVLPDSAPEKLEKTKPGFADAFIDRFAASA